MEGLIFGILRYSVSESVDQTTEWLFITYPEYTCYCLISYSYFLKK